LRNNSVSNGFCQENPISQSTSHTVSERLQKSARSVGLTRRLKKLFARKAVRRRSVRYGLIAGNAILLAGIMVFVFQGSHNPSTQRLAGITSSNSAASTDPLDQLSSADIAVSVARMTQLSEAGEVANQAISANTEMTLASTDNTVASKPLAVLTALKSRKDIQTYTTVPGDTVSSVAAKFSVTSDSIRWSNGITGDNVGVGTKLTIPPVTGIVYTVKAGDTPDSLAQKFKADRNQIVAYNDAEISGLKQGEQIIIPNGQQAAVATSSYGGAGSYGLGYLGGTPTYGGNMYEYGWCTWHAFNRRAQLGNPVAGNLGDAYTWASRSAAFGVPTGSAPRAGAVAVKHSKPPGHVAVVEVVNDDGSFWISEMNSYGQVSMTNSTPTGGFGRIDYKLISADGANEWTFVY
jgi:surface antigen